jgi:hypothetical protein
MTCLYHIEVSNYNTRQCDNFHVPYCRLVPGSNSSRVFGVNVLNNTQKDFRNTTLLTLFRTKYKLYVIYK